MGTGFQPTSHHNCTAGNLTTRGCWLTARPTPLSNAPPTKTNDMYEPGFTMASISRVHRVIRFLYAQESAACRRTGATVAVCEEGDEECARALLEVPGRGLHPALEREDFFGLQCRERL